ncbi:unnamed protein product [Microthlaspi erraticum]|uniref:Reverse transcriptase Ty1/copia-type domain-containing protein n=1 Tax=Microthlaspi erraticum TaxID=1685480 RepID=A0A6D2JBJ9_9BRAS|nr:unnamed protein product [Microthlaspi erraticum]
MATRAKSGISKPNRHYLLSAMVTSPCEVEPRTAAQALKDDKWRNAMRARLVALGYNHRPGLDYAETFSPVVKSTTIRVILGVVVDRSWPIRQLDVNNAFLQGTLTDEVYMSQPPGFVDRDWPHTVCRLRKAIYDLKQAPRAWYVELRNYLVYVGL